VLSTLLRRLSVGPVESSEQGWELALAPGQEVGRFQLVRELGRGGFGVVFEAQDTALGRTVALKAVRTGERVSLRQERLLQEAEAAAKLSHPNIVTLFELGLCEQGPYLVLEFLQGKTLEAQLMGGAVPVREAVRIAVEVAKGLAHAHGRGVVHRDLSTGNVFLCSDGAVKVLDFGLAHIFGHRRVAGGTPAFMAPEQWAQAPEDERTDVFALGVMLYNMLSGDLPFPAGEVAKELAGPSPAPELEVVEAPALGALVARMLEKNPEKRPRDGAEVLDALGAIQRGLERSPAAPAPVRSRRKVAGRAALVAAGLTLGAMGVAFGVWRAMHPAAAEPRPSIAVLPFADMSPQRDQEYFSDGLAEEILNGLAHVEGLRVPGRTSSFYFKGKSVELAEIGRRLDVANVLEGSVRKEGNRIRVIAQVVRVADGDHLWSETYDRELTGIFALQEEIAQSVAKALRVRLLPGLRPAASDHRGSQEAYSQYMAGKQLLMPSAFPFTAQPRESRRRALQAFQSAVALDPHFAVAWRALSRATFVEAHLSDSDADRSAGFRRSMEAVEREIALSPEWEEGFLNRAFLRAAIQRDWAGAQADLERALALSPNSVGANRAYGFLLADLGRFPEAISAFRKAIELDPLDRWNWDALGFLYGVTRQFESARGSIERSIQLSGWPRPAIASLATIHLFEGRAGASLAAFARADSQFQMYGTALAQHSLGNATESQRAMDWLIAQSGVAGSTSELENMIDAKVLNALVPSEPRYRVATVYAWRGDRDRAFEWLERARAHHELSLGGIKVNPLLQRIRDDSRYTAFLREMNLPEN
jgi:serine/threonine-protein kinase